MAPTSSSMTSSRSRRVHRISLPSRSSPNKRMDPPSVLNCPARHHDSKGSIRYSDTNMSCMRTRESTWSASGSIASNRPKVVHTTGLPKTLSTSTSATETSSSTFSILNDKNCPVTGTNSDVFAHYRVMPDVLGSGKYGNVKECYSRSSGRSFAVKSIDKSKVGRLDHLKQEVANLSNVNHENIIKMVDCFENAEYLHIVTEKYSGGELFDKIIENRSSAGCFSEAKAARIITSLLKAVAYLHSKDIVHRDIKPENIIFAYSGENSDVKLIDFGLSRRHEQGEEPMSNPVGTSYYMSPEVLRRKYDKSCDVWSIGIVAYILLCGYPPFNGITDSKIQESILGGKLRFGGKGWGDKSRHARDFISCLLRSDRERLSCKQALNHPWIVMHEVNFMECML